jgi:lipopolysaccharide export system permease protein
VKIIDRYILKKFLFTFFAILLVLSVVIALIDFTSKNEAFIRTELSYREILDYYSAFLPFLVNFLTPIIVFITIIFVTSRLAQRSEIIAILGNGIGYLRFMRPYVIGAAFISLLSFVLMGWVLAGANKKRIDYEDQLGFSIFFTPCKYLHIRISPESYLYIEKYRSVTHMGMNATIETIIDNKMVEKLYAKYLSWDEDTQLWILRDWTLRKIGDVNEHITQGHLLKKDLKINPKDLEMNPRLYETQTLPELHRHIRDLENKQSDSIRLFRTERHIRYMAPFASIILTIMGVVVASYKSRRGAGLQISVGIALSFIYIAMFLFTRGYAEAKGANIFLTIWTPNLLFSAISFVIYKIVPK